jgi:type IV pilus assembly protein PilA
MKTMMNETPNETIKTNSRGNMKMKKFTKLFKNEKGLTLIELLAVIVILAIVSAIAVPSIGGIIENTRIKAVKADAVTILNAANLYFTDNSTKTTVDEVGLAEFLDSSGEITTFDVAKGTASAGNTLTATVDETGYKVEFILAPLSQIDATDPDTDGSTVIVTKK